MTKHKLLNWKYIIQGKIAGTFRESIHCVYTTFVAAGMIVPTSQ